MQGVRIQLRQLAFGTQSFTPILPGEPVFDPSTKRFGIGVGGDKAVWYPKATSQGNLEFEPDQGLVSADGNVTLKFTQTGLQWKVGGVEVFATRGSDGVAVKSGVMLRNVAGADAVLIGYAHWVAIMTLMWNIKALLRKFVANTATNADVDALLTPLVGLNLTTLDPAFPERNSL
jgi:hypothetical protein